MKKIINDPTAVVDEMLDGLAIFTAIWFIGWRALISLPARVRRQARLA